VCSEPAYLDSFNPFLLSNTCTLSNTHPQTVFCKGRSTNRLNSEECRQSYDEDHNNNPANGKCQELKGSICSIRFVNLQTTEINSVGAKFMKRTKPCTFTHTCICHEVSGQSVILQFESVNITFTCNTQVAAQVLCSLFSNEWLL